MTVTSWRWHEGRKLFFLTPNRPWRLHQDYRTRGKQYWCCRDVTTARGQYVSHDSMVTCTPTHLCTVTRSTRREQTWLKCRRCSFYRWPFSCACVVSEPGKRSLYRQSVQLMRIVPECTTVTSSKIWKEIKSLIITLVHNYVGRNQSLVVFQILLVEIKTGISS